MDNLDFRQFLELRERKPNYFTAMQDELGVKPEMIEKSPMWASNIAMGNFSFNGITYKVVRLVNNGGKVTGAMIKPVQLNGVDSQRSYVKFSGNQVRRPVGDVDEKERFISIQQLNDIMTQGLSTASAAGGAGFGGLPGNPSGGPM